MAARPIVLDAPPRDPRAELMAQLQDAPREHAEALLAAYEVLQGLHDRGALELIRGLLGSSDEVLDIAVGALRGPQATRTLQNLVILANVLGSIDPNELRAFSRILPPIVKSASLSPEPRSMRQLISGFLWNRDLRRALTMIQNVLIGLGKALVAK